MQGEDRQARLKRALKENMGRRKAQARSRSDGMAMPPRAEGGAHAGAAREPADAAPETPPEDRDG